jgi:glycosyltransferase involved in cell wall biosynthesis
MRKGIDLLRQVADLDYVELMITDGRLSSGELPAFYRKLDYVLITSRYEGGPMSLLEGLACGKKVICPGDVGLAEQFPDGIVSYVNGDIVSLKEILQNLFDEKQRLSALVKKHTWDNWALQHLRLFSSFIQYRCGLK